MKNNTKKIVIGVVCLVVLVARAVNRYARIGRSVDAVRNVLEEDSIRSEIRRVFGRVRVIVVIVIVIIVVIVIVVIEIVY